MILQYSAIKIRAKLVLLYSTLKPDTSSDSPSAKSNGVRFVSASVDTNQMNKRGGMMMAGVDRGLFIKWFMLKERWIMIADMRIRVIETSYEIVWATLRREPKRAYLELEAQPAIITG